MVFTSERSRGGQRGLVVMAPSLRDQDGATEGGRVVRRKDAVACSLTHSLTHSILRYNDRAAGNEGDCHSLGSR